MEAMRSIFTKKVFVFACLLVLAGVFAPFYQAHAIFGIGDVGLFDIPMMQLDALDFVDNVVMRFLIWAFVLFIESQLLVLIGGGVLEWAAGLQVPLQSALIQTGWQFMTGLVNLALVIILLAVAFSAILRMDAFPLRKTLTRLVLVALFINFSLLFVGVFVDVAQVLINTIKEALGGNFVQGALAPLKTLWRGPLIAASTALGLKIGLALVPFGNIVSAVGTAALFLTDLIVGKGWFLQFIVLTVFNFLAGMIFLLFAFLFVARIIVIGLLAVFAPLALAAAVLPATKKYWDQWLGALISWSFVGVVALFLMGLGMKLAGAPDTIGGNPVGFGPKGLGFGEGELYKTLFLLAYLVVAFLVAKRLTPIGADMMITSFRKLGSQAIGKAGIPALAEIGRRIAPKLEQWGRGRRMAAEKLGAPPGLKNWKDWRGYGERIKWATSGTGLRHLGGMTIGRPIEGLAGQATQHIKARDERLVREAMQKQNMRGRDSRDLMRIFNQKKGERISRTAAVLAMIENGDQDDLQEYTLEGLMNGKEVGDLFRFGGERFGPPVYRPMMKALSGFILQEPGLLGLPADRNAPVWGEMTRAGLEREILEKLNAGEINGGMLGNFIKRFGDVIPARQGGGGTWGQRFGGRLIQHLIERPELIGPLVRKVETRQGRRDAAELVQNHINTRTFQQIRDENLLPLVRFLYSETAAGAGITGAYTDPVTQQHHVTYQSFLRAFRGATRQPPAPPGPAAPQPPPTGGPTPPETPQGGGEIPPGFTQGPGGLVIPLERRRPPPTGGGTP